MTNKAPWGSDEYRPHGPRLGFGYLDSGLPPEAGFYQPPNAEQIKLSEILPAEAEAQADFNLSLDDYQAWCDLNWKKPHGTVESAERLRAKLLEESREVQEAVSLPETSRSLDDIKSELGDLLWCVNGISSDLNVSVKHGMMMLLDRYGRGTRYFHDRSAPAWVKTAQMVTFDDNMSLLDIDKMVNEGYEPQVPTDMLIDADPEPVIFGIQDALNHIDIHTRLLSSITAINYDKDNYQSGETYQADVAGHLVGRIYLDAAFLAKYSAGSSLTEVVRQNILKLSERVDKNIVDKSDGPRS